MDSSKLVDFLWALFLLIVAPGWELIQGIFQLFYCGPKRPMEKEIVLVTGAAQGLGRGMALEFAKLGATVICWDINENGCQETAELAKKVSKGQASIYSYVCDISNRDEVAAVAGKVQIEVGQVTILINNAGIVTAGQLQTYTAKDISRVVVTNFTSHFWTIEAFLPHMKKVNSGQIVCIASMSAVMPVEYLVPYSATKCAVTGLMDALDEELVSLGFDKINLTTVHPFFTATTGLKNQLTEVLDVMMDQRKRVEEGPNMLEPSEVVKNIVSGVVAKKREFTIPNCLLHSSKLLKLYPRYVSRACKQVLLGKWKLAFTERKNYI